MTGVDIVGMVVTAITAVRAALKALRMTDGREIEDERRLTASEIVKTTWKCYTPAAATGACSAACIIETSSTSARRSATLVTAYTISKITLKEYKDRATEAVGLKKEQTIQDAVTKGQPKQIGAPERKSIPTGRGETPCFNPLTSVYFRSDYETPRGVENTLSRRLRDGVKITASDFLEELGLPSCDPAIGDSLGWDVSKGWVGFDFSSQSVDGVPYLVIGHYNPPQYIGWRHPQKLHLPL